MATELYEKFEEKLFSIITDLLISHGYAKDRLPLSDDIGQKWDDSLAEGYIADAVRDFNAYPEYCIACAGYLGMGAAYWWDQDFGQFTRRQYTDYLGKNGFDDLDEHICRDLLSIPLASEEFGRLADVLFYCSQASLDLIRHEGIEPGTADAVYIFHRCCRVLFKAGAAIQFSRMGYRMAAL